MTNYKTINARACAVGVVSNSFADDFFREHHRSGAIHKKSGAVSYAIFHEGEPVGVIQFGSPRTSKMRNLYSVELYRLAFASGVRVRGGASKLIKSYIEKSRPRVTDFFTYQDTSGEATAVYEHAGMTLVSQAKKKQYLVAPRRTLETGSRKEVLGMAYATRYGPDRILGTKLGEVYREDGTRKSNKTLFLEELGWHIEETSGDRVYEWVNENYTFYTYKITATDSDKYYYGVARINKKEATIEDCLNDRYWGSGGKHKGNKFANWKKNHKSNLKKEIMGIYNRRTKAFLAEDALIGDKWMTDPLCLNSRAGGQLTAPHIRFIGLKNCPIHGEVIHQGAICGKCNREKANRKAVCPHHGLTLFRGSICATCIAKSSITTLNCPVHGEVIHQGKICSTCNAEKSVAYGHCQKHGTTKFKKEKCAKCVKAVSYSLKICTIHGETRHTGSRCQLCIVQDSYSLALCQIHGETKFHGGKCMKCRPSNVFLKECPTHGKVKHRGSACYGCIADKRKATVGKIKEKELKGQDE